LREFTVPPVVTVPDPANLTDPVWDNAERAGQEPLVAAGIEPGTRIGLMSGTRYEWTVVDYAAWACGAVTVPIYETSSSEQAEWILSDSAAVACVVETADHAALVEGIRGGLPGLKHLWRIDTQDSPTHRRLPPTLDELVAAGSAVDPAEIEVRRRGVDADDAATIIYTSGTTGRPKGCVLTHRNVPRPCCSCRWRTRSPA
jgi:long-chain acyl-CoA synthetase